MPPVLVRVLVWDNQEDKWVIARLEYRQNTPMWVLDPHIFYGYDAPRFGPWQDLPGRPNGR